MNIQTQEKPQGEETPQAEDGSQETTIEEGDKEAQRETS